MVPAIENLDHNWSQIVYREGNQLATVGHHWKLSRALNKEEIVHRQREGTCLTCHQDILENSAAINLLHHVAEYTGQLPKTNQQHANLIHKILLTSAWGQVLGAVAISIAGLGGIFWWLRRRQPNQQN
ncbi:hypothetical protein [Aureliella helgolandensis]|uniref:Uncharacterized protein n=1 Tax=Aureliella helgolandensis TaxID=2527968 RepID=A0A518G1D9_9BACT|nr:hypothetical protein [Aureliella helgolandensis]QDV22360.1 hypothetical protein Q31a_06440 [Aureliella helgolandensis]